MAFEMSPLALRRAAADLTDLTELPDRIRAEPTGAYHTVASDRRCPAQAARHRLARSGRRSGAGRAGRGVGGVAGAARLRHLPTIIQAGLLIESEEVMPEDDSGHQLFWARRR